MTKQEIIDEIDLTIAFIPMQGFGPLFFIDTPPLSKELLAVLGEDAHKVGLARKHSPMDFMLISDIKKTLKDHNLGVIKILNYSAMLAVVHIFELLKSNGLKDDQSEVHNFLYHLRNAAAHGNKFKINNPNFTRVAKFEDLEITGALNGTSPVFGGFIEFGDVISLLRAIKNELQAS